MESVTTIQDARDGLETAILSALMMDKRSALMKPVKRQDIEVAVLGQFCPPGAAFPKAAYTFDAARSSERLFSPSLADLVVDPIAVIAKRFETAILCEDGLLKWTCIIPMEKKPVGLVAISNRPVRWFTYHFRTFRGGDPQTYVKRPLAVTLDGDVAMMKPLGSWNGYNAAKDRDEMAEQLAIKLSIFEDAHRANAFLATVEEHVRLMFPVGADSYRSFLAMRDGYRDTPTGRRNPILHWCATHMRQTARGRSVVAEHLRGAEEFVVGPMRLTLEPTKGYAGFMR